MKTALMNAAAFAAAMFCVAPLPGVNEPHYLTKALSFVQPGWNADDFFLASGNAHWCFFVLTGPAVKFLGFMATAVVGRLICALLFGIAWQRVARILGLSSSASLSAAGLWILLAMLGTYSGEWVLGGFESKVPAYGFCLLSLSFAFEPPSSPHFQLSRGSTSILRRVGAAGVFSGLAICLHPVVGLWYAGGIFLVLTIAGGQPPARRSADPSTRRVRSAASDDTGHETLPDASAPPSHSTRVVTGITYFLTAVLIGLPGIVPAIAVTAGSGAALSERDLNRAHYFQVFARLKHHLDPMEFPLSSWLYAGGLTAVCLVCGFLLRRQSPHSSGYAEVDLPRRNAGDAYYPVRALSLLLIVAWVVAVAGVITAWRTVPAGRLPGWEWRAALLRFYPFRFVDSLLPICCALLTAKAVLGKPRPDSTANTSVASWKNYAAPILLIMTGLILAGRAQPTAPSGYTASQFSEWKAVCTIMDSQLPADALVLTPRESFGFKWYARRAEFVAYKDCPQDPPGILEWNRRLWLIHDWAEEAWADGQFNHSDLQRLKQLTGVTHILTRSLGPFETTPVLRHGEWSLYSVDESRRRGQGP